MNRFVIMVDAGYLLRQAIEIVSNKASNSRAALHISDPARLIQILLEKSRSTLNLEGKELLRVYWYDGVMSNGFSTQQRALIGVDDVQFRAGTINGRGQQKGVDSLIVTDLIELISHRAVCDAVLVTGDSDLAVGIEVAQKRGVRIAVLGVEDLASGVVHHQSFEITSRADRVGMLGRADLLQVFSFSPAFPANAQQPALAPLADSTIASAPASDSANAGNTMLQAAVKEFIAQRTDSLSNAVDPSTQRIQSEVDKALLHHVFVALGRRHLSEDEKIQTRLVFRAAM